MQHSLFTISHGFKCLVSFPLDWSDARSHLPDVVGGEGVGGEGGEGAGVAGAGDGVPATTGRVIDAALSTACKKILFIFVNDCFIHIPCKILMR